MFADAIPNKGRLYNYIRKTRAPMKNKRIIQAGKINHQNLRCYKAKTLEESMSFLAEFFTT